MYYLLVLQECSSIEVSGGFTWTRGTYVLSDEKISNDSSRPLWKQTNKTLNKTNYIFNDGSSNGWQIGYKKGLRYRDSSNRTVFGTKKKPS